MNDRPRFQEQIHYICILCGRLKAEVGNTDRAFYAFNVKAIFYADREPVQRSVELACAFEMGVEEMGTG